MGLTVGGLAESNLGLGTAGVVILGALLVGAIALERLSESYFKARWEAVEAHLGQQDRSAVIAQATGLGPDYLARACLFKFLDEQAPGWSDDHVDTLGKLAVSAEIPRAQQTLIQNSLNKRHPGWSMGDTRAA